MTTFQGVASLGALLWPLCILVAISPCIAFSNCTSYCTTNGTYMAEEDCGPYGYCCGSPPFEIACCTAYYMEVTDVPYNITPEVCLLLLNQTFSGQESVYLDHHTTFPVLLMTGFLQIALIRVLQI